MRKKQPNLIGFDGELLTPDQNIDVAEYTEFVQERGSHSMWDAPTKGRRQHEVRYWAIVLAVVVGGLMLLSNAGEERSLTMESPLILDRSGTLAPFIGESNKTLFSELLYGEGAGDLESVTRSDRDWLHETSANSAYLHFLPASRSNHRPLYSPTILKMLRGKGPFKRFME